jgi:hypothetical protein
MISLLEKPPGPTGKALFMRLGISMIEIYLPNRAKPAVAVIS